MGFFSWKTSDTNKSIANKHSDRRTIPVKMLDDKGNEWFEHDYEGYGVFGGKDYYELLAEMNPRKRRNIKDKRSRGITIAFDLSLKNVKRPKFSAIGNQFAWHDLPDSPICEYQGYFY
jgi:hypothetical protein